jgi:hypothetical protein
VSGSYVNVRASATKNAAVLDKLLINTAVMVQNQSDGFCEISWGLQQHGFVACNLLSAKPTSLSEVGAEKLADGKPNPNYSPTRAFWLQPTNDRLMAVARSFDKTMIPAKERELETRGLTGEIPRDALQPIKRFAIPELDAMRALLGKGVLAPKELGTAPYLWDSSKAAFLPEGTTYSASAYQWAYQQIKLPQAKPSYFKNVTDVISPKVTPENISAQLGIPWKLQVDSPAFWGGDEVVGVLLAGVWDMGKVTQRLDKPVYSFAIDERGNIATAKNFAETSDIAGGDPHPCAPSRHIVWPEKDQVAKNTQGDLLVLYRGLQTLPFSKAKLSLSKQSLVQPKNLGNKVKFVSATMSVIDLDSDGVADIVVWEGINKQPNIDQQGFAEYKVKLIFANIQGRWYYLEHDIDDAYCAD